MKHQAELHELGEDGVVAGGAGLDVEARAEALPAPQFNSVAKEVQELFKVCAVLCVSIKLSFFCLVWSYEVVRIQPVTVLRWVSVQAHTHV